MRVRAWQRHPGRDAYGGDSPVRYTPATAHTPTVPLMPDRALRPTSLTKSFFVFGSTWMKGTGAAMCACTCRRGAAATVSVLVAVTAAEVGNEDARSSANLGLGLFYFRRGSVACCEWVSPML